MGRKVRSSCDSRLDRARVKTCVALALHTAVFDDRVSLDDQFSHGISKIASACDADVALDNFRFTAAAEKN